jgi:hypothetical protein
LLHPAAGHGVRRVSGAGFPIQDLASQIAAGGPIPSSRRTFTPPEGTLDCSRTTSPWPLPPCRWPPVPFASSSVAVASVVLRAPPDRSLDFEALLRHRVQTSRDRCRPSDALSFHGLCSPSRSLRRTQALKPAPAVLLTTKIRRRPCVSATSSVPHPQRPYAANPGPPSLRKPNSGVTPSLDPEEPNGATWHQTPMPFRRMPPAGMRRPARRPSTSRSRSVSRHEDERGRVPEAVGIPSAVHRGTAGSRSSRA